MGNDNLPSRDYIEYICGLYDDVYDDRIEDCCPPMAGKAQRKAGEYWLPGQRAHHKRVASLLHFILKWHAFNTRLRKNLC